MNNYFEKRNRCPVCGSSNHQLIFMQKFADFFTAEISQYDVVVCTDCGFAYANNLPSQKEIDLYYTNSNKYEEDSPGYTSQTEYLWNEKIIEYVAEHYSKTTAIADYGCGTGFILRKLKDLGYSELSGLDTSTSNCDYLKQIGIHAINKSMFLITPDEFNKKIDVGICVGVMEHIIDLNDFIFKVITTLKPNSELIVCVPDIKPLEGKLYPFQEFSTEHINYFTYETLCGLLAEFDMHPIDRYSADGAMIVVFSLKQSYIGDLLNEYTIHSKIRIDSMLKRIDYLIDSQKPVVVYGLGTLTRYLLANTRFSKLNITAFADGNKLYQGKALIGRPVLPPEKIQNADTIVICSYNANDAIKNKLCVELHYNNDIIVMS